ncbi:MAG: ATP-binding protein [Rhizomicrobium sp.]
MQSSLETPSGSWSLAVVAALLAIAIYAVDTYTPSGVAVAVLYVIVILLSANVISRQGTFYVAAGCAALAVVSYLVQHGPLKLDAPFARLAMSLSAIGITGFLAYRNQTSQIGLRAAEAELRATLDTIPALVMRTGPDGAVAFMNACWRAQGFSETDLRADWLALVHPDDRAAIAEKRAQSLATGEAYESEMRLQRADGDYRWLASRTVPVRDDKGHVVARYVAAMDIEDRKRAEAALHKAQAELTHVTRMTTLGEFTTSIAHEVNQPLAAIVTNGEVCLRLLELEPPDKEELREATRDIIASGRRASEIITRVRALSRKEGTKKSPLDLNEVIEEVIPLLRGEALKYQLSLRLEPTPGLRPIWGDRIELQQVLINLIVNGMEAMAPVADDIREVVIRSRQDESGEAAVEIVDRGPGLRDEDTRQMFDAFFTTKPNGMGMGLAICRTIIESHGGRLWATNNAGRGATLQFALPPYRGAHP